MSEENKAPAALTAGSTAPDFTLPARSGKSISLHDFAGQKDVLIYFYPKDDTPGCTRESCSLRDGWADLGKAGIEVLGISRDGAASHNAFAAKYNLPFELLTDADHAVHEAYGAWGQNPNPAWGVGPLRKSFLIGKDGKIKHVFEKVDTEHHADQVLKAAGFAPAPKPAPAPAAAHAAPTVAGVAEAARSAVTTAVAKVAEKVEKAAAVVEKAALKTAAPAAPKVAAAKKAVQKAVKKAVRTAKKAVAKAKVKKAVRKVKKAVAKAKAKKAAPKKKAAKKKAARKMAARKPVRKVAKKAKKAAPKRKAKKAAKRKKR
jgi:peroxiredoxin Q/BCP